MTRFRLNPALDPLALAAAWRRDRRVRIRDFLLVEDAAAIRAHLAARDDWRQVLNSDDKVFELDRPTRAAMDAAAHARLDDAVMAGARKGFQFRYETIRVSDAASTRRSAPDDDLLSAFAAWLSDGEPMALLRRITAAKDTVFADAQATAYAPGDFLTRHDDDVAGKDRRAAYVFGLNHEWRAEWGGLLLFHAPDGSLHGLSPGFNTLDLLAVPQSHSVSMVTRAAPNRRYAVTGWLRAQPQPA